MNVTIVRVPHPTALFHRYPGEQQEQDCFLALDLETGRLECDWNGEIGNGVPMSVHHRRALRWTIPTLTDVSANELMDKVAPLAQRILDGSSVEWDGNNNVGRLNADAEDADDEIRDITEGWGEEPDLVHSWSAFDWYSEGDDPAPELGLTADTTDGQLYDIEKKAEADINATAEGVVVVHDLREYLESRRNEMRTELREKLEQTAEQISVLEAERDALIRRVAGWGVDSDRALAALVGKSHRWVQLVRKSGSGKALDPANSILDRLNAYQGENIWPDLILSLDGYDEAATAAIDSASDRFVAAGQIYRYDGQNSRWYAAGEYEATPVERVAGGGDA